jgi:hypothetical protein
VHFMARQFYLGEMEFWIRKLGNNFDLVEIDNINEISTNMGQNIFIYIFEELEAANWAKIAIEMECRIEWNVGEVREGGER